jgi:hypothetical protein
MERDQEAEAAIELENGKEKPEKTDLVENAMCQSPVSGA